MASRAVSDSSAARRSSAGRVAHSSLPLARVGQSYENPSVPMDDNVVCPPALGLRHANVPTQAKTGLEWATNPITSYVAILNTVVREVILSSACRSENPWTGPMP
jgi:hypothetical protein